MNADFFSLLFVNPLENLLSNDLVLKIKYFQEGCPVKAMKDASDVEL